MFAPLTCVALSLLSGWQPPGTRSFAAVLAVDPKAAPTRVSGSIRLVGIPDAEVAATLSRVRVNGWPAGRTKKGGIAVSDNSMDVATPSSVGAFSLELERQELWWIEASADGFEPAGVVVPCSATVEFVLFRRTPPR